MTDEQIKALVQLKELKEQGILSQEEFEKEKASILNTDIRTQQSPLTPPNDGPAKPVNDNPDEKKIESARTNVKKKEEKTSWIKENWWMILVPILIALAKVISRM